MINLEKENYKVDIKVGDEIWSKPFDTLALCLEEAMTLIEIYTKDHSADFKKVGNYEWESCDLGVKIVQVELATVHYLFEAQNETKTQ